MTGERDTDWDLVEDLVFQCLEARADGSEAGHARMAALLAAQEESVQREVGKVIADVAVWDVASPPVGCDLRIPDRLGPYRPGRRLGQGGMGAVFEAVDESLGRRVAIKVIRPDLLALGGARERFRREVEAVARLSHPGIVPVYQVGEESGVPWFAMELVEGESLAEALRRLAGRDPAALRGEDLRQALPGDATSRGSTAFGGSWEHVCIRIARELADALAHAHGRSVLHRDVKPSNVVVDATGHARLLDFGLAHSNDGSQLTRTGALLGSLPYLPPEQLRGDCGDPDARADVYSLGVTLYEMLTLRSPFLAEREAITRRNVEQGHCQPPGHWHRTLSWECAAVTGVAMDRDPDRRYQSMAEFAADLQRILDRRPIVARPPSAWLRVRRSAERHPVAATGIVAAALAAIALLLVHTIGLANERDRAVTAQREAQRLRGEEQVQKDLALTAQREAEGLRAVDRVRSYRACIQAAHFALRLGQATAAREQLARCPEEMREFEWRHLHAQIDESLATITTSDQFLRCIAVTAGGLLTAGADGTLRHVSMADEHAVSEFTPAQPVGILSMAATHDGRHVVTGHADHVVRLWQGESRSLRAEITFDGIYGDRELEARHRTCFAVAITDDGSKAYAVGAAGAVMVIDVATGKRSGGFLLPMVRGGVFSVAVNAAADLLAVGHDHDILLVRPDGRVERVLRGHRGFVFSLQFAKAGDYLLSASQDRTARLWRVSDGEPGTVLFGHDGEVHQATFGDDGTAWTVSNDSTLRNWNLMTGRERQRRQGHDTAIYGVATASHGGNSLVVTAGWDGTVRLWDARVGKARFRIGQPGRTVRQQLLVHDGGRRCSLVDVGNGVRTFALPSGEAVEPIVSGEVSAVAVRNGQIAVLREGQLLVGAEQTALAGAREELTGICYLENGTLTGVEAGGHVLFWSAEGGVATRCAAHDGAVQVLEPFAGGCVTAGKDGRVLIWSGHDSRELLRRDTVWDGAAMSPDGDILYLAGLRKVLAVEVVSGKVRWEREVAGRMRDVATASGGRRLLVGGSDRILHILDATDGEEIVGLPADNLLQAIAVVEDVAVTATVYSEVDLWYGR